MSIHTDHAIEPPQMNTDADWFNVKRGTIEKHTTKQLVAGLSGNLVGVRTRKSRDFDSYELHLLIVDGEESYILSGALTYSNDGEPPQLNTWARMLLGRIGNPANNVTPADRIRVEIVPRTTNGGNVATLCYVARDGETAPLLERPIETGQDLEFAAAHVAFTFPWDSMGMPLDIVVASGAPRKPAAATEPATAGATADADLTF